MMKHWVVFFLFISISPCFGSDAVKAIYNPHTGKLDFINKLSSASAGDLADISTTGAISGQALVYDSDIKKFTPQAQSFSTFDEGVFQGNVSSVNITGDGVSTVVNGGTLTIIINSLGMSPDATYYLKNDTSTGQNYSLPLSSMTLSSGTYLTDLLVIRNITVQIGTITITNGALLIGNPTVHPLAIRRPLNVCDWLSGAIYNADGTSMLGFGFTGTGSATDAVVRTNGSSARGLYLAGGTATNQLTAALCQFGINSSGLIVMTTTATTSGAMGAGSNTMPPLTRFSVQGGSTTFKGIDLIQAIAGFVDQSGDYRMVISTNGNISIGMSTGSYILQINQGSDTDPIADTWATYTSTRKYKIITKTDPTGYLDKVKAQPLYEYKRKAIVPDDQVPQLKIVDGFEVPLTPIEIAAEKSRMIAEKEALPKYATARVGMAVDDPQTPSEVLIYDKSGNIEGIDLLGYIGYLHLALKELNTKVEALESAIK